MSEPSIRLRIKAVPGASRDAVVGWLGDALKVSVRAPPEKGRANAALCAVLAQRLGLPAAAVSVVGGHGSVHKTVAIQGISLEQVRQLLGP